MIKKLVLIILALTALSCSIPYIYNQYLPTNKESLKYLYQEMKDHYVYTEFKGVDLDARYAYYNSIINDNMEEEEFFYHLSEFMNELEDGHSNIISPFAVSSYYDDIIGNDTDEFNQNYNDHIIDHYYLEQESGYEFQTLNGVLTNGVIIEDDGSLYGYIYYESFMSNIDTGNLEDIIERFETLGVKGIILDLRSNGGGSLANMVTLVSYFGYDPSSDSKQVAKVWRKDSSNSYTEIDQLDLAPLVSLPFTVDRAEKGYQGEVALLTNRGSYSASSFTATAFKQYANVKQIGTATGGGMGLPIGGTMPNGWTYRLSGNVTLSADAPGIESLNDTTYNWENGVPADIDIEDDLSTTDRDEIIDRAIEWFNR